MRNPCPVLQVSQETASNILEEGEDDAKSAWPFDALGCTRDTMAGTAGSEAVRRSQSLKTSPSPDWGLKPAPMKLESLVIANQPCRDEYVSRSCTHRPSHQESWQYPKLRFYGIKVRSVIMMKS